MAAGRKSGYRFFAQSMEKETNNGGFASEELDESDVWGCTIEPTQSAEAIRNNPIPSSRSNRKKSSAAAADKGDRVPGAAASLPMNIPDWSKILKDEEEYRGNNNKNSSSNSYSKGRRLLELDEDEDEDEVNGIVIPPHELLWKNRAASFSVHEGIGRTLKGRDLSRVRNAIFEKIGFED